MATLKYYSVDSDGKIQRLRRECPSETCGAGIFMAFHKDRQYCGKCHTTCTSVLSRQLMSRYFGEGWRRIELLPVRDRNALKNRLSFECRHVDRIDVDRDASCI
jgi:ribosomal protein S27AE